VTFVAGWSAPLLSIALIGVAAMVARGNPGLRSEM
jgi:hypothetical protein